MKNVNTFAVATRAFAANAWAAHAAMPAHAAAPAAAANHKRRTATATATFVDGSTI